MRKIDLPPSILQDIVLKYKSGLSTKNIGKEFGYSGEFIRQLLINNDISLRKYNEINKKYDVNETLFDNIDCEEKAYFLGLLFSDGNVHSKYNAITLKLNDKDKDILIKLSNMIYGKDILYKSNDNYILKFSNHNIKNKLIDLGCVPNKTFKLKFPNIDKNLLSCAKKTTSPVLVDELAV